MKLTNHINQENLIEGIPEKEKDVFTLVMYLPDSNYRGDIERKKDYYHQPSSSCSVVVSNSIEDIIESYAQAKVSVLQDKVGFGYISPLLLVNGLISQHDSDLSIHVKDSSFTRQKEIIKERELKEEQERKAKEKEDFLIYKSLHERFKDNPEFSLEA
jgi:hypothetical protein